MLNKKEKILIVDDNTQNLQYLGSILLEERYQIIAANNGKKALELAEQQVPDLILLDIMMPEMDGFETSQKLKENHKTNQIPIIFLTAKTELEDLQKGFNLGAVDHITKPFHPVELLLRLNTHLSLSKSQREYKELLHILSHDLDNYFGIIQGSIQAIESDYSDLPFYLPMLKESTHLGIELVKLVRDMRHIEEKPLKLEAVHLLTAFEYSKDILQPSYFKKNLSLELEIPDTIYILSERVSFISSVANNILSNAAKFSFNGSTVYVQARTEASQVIVSIKDTRIGIA